MTEAPSLRESALRGVVWSFAERWLVRIVSLAVLVLLGRLLTPQDFGVVAAASVLVDFVGIFIATGLSTFLVQAEELTERMKNTALIMSVVTGLIFAGSLAAAAPLIAPLLRTDGLVPLIQVLSIGLIFASVAGVPTALMSRELRFRQVFFRSVTATVLSAVLAVAAAFAGMGAWALVIQTVSFSIVRTVSVWLAVRWRPRLMFDRADAYEMLRYALNIIGITLLAFMRTRGEVFLVATMRDPVSLGIWVVGRRIVNVVAELFTTIVTRVATPVFARAKSDTDRLRRGYVSAVSMSAAVCSPVLAVTAAAAPLGVPLLFSSKWDGAGQITAMMALGFIPTITGYMNRGLLLAMNRSGLELRYMIFTATSQVTVTAAVLGLGASLRQLAVALALREIVSWPIRLWTVRRALPFDVAALVTGLLRTWVAAAVAGLVAYGLIWWLEDVIGPWSTVVVASVAGVLTYVPALRLLNPIAFRDVLSTLRSVLGKRGASKPSSDGELV